MNSITVKQLIEALKIHNPDSEIDFGSTLDGTPLVFYRVKSRGVDVVQIELNEVLDGDGD